MISSLDRKLLRDLSQMKGQSLAIALVIAAGVATLVNSQSLLHSLELTRSTFYDRYRFAHVFASVKRAPDTLAARIAEIPGVTRVETRIIEGINLDVPGLVEPAVGQIISMPLNGQPALNQVHLRRGRLLAPGRDDEVLASEKFTIENNLKIGDQIAAIINGRRKPLTIVGVVLSPEYVFQIKPGDIVPDPKHFGIFWMNHEAVSMAFDMEGAFNNVALSLMRGADENNVLFQLDRLLDPYGGRGAYARKDQLSHMLLESDIEGLRTTGLIAPTIFLCVAAFLLNVVLTRLLSLQREQIAALKAFGYTNLDIGWHYLKFVLLITLVGAALGALGGIRLSREFTIMFARVYQYPELIFGSRGSIIAAAVGIAMFAAVAGAFGAVLRAVRVPPAEAMRPEPPATYRLTLLERLGIGRYVPPVGHMILRELERRPIKTGFSVLAIALSVGILVVGNFIEDAVDWVMYTQFHRVQRFDMMVSTIEPISTDLAYELTHLPGVQHAEPMRSVAVRMRSGHISRRLAIMGLPVGMDLMQLVNRTGAKLPVPAGGMVMSRKLAEVMGIKAGEAIRVEVLEGKRPVLDIPVVALLDDISGLNAYMSFDELNRVLREGPRANGAYLRTDPMFEDELFHELKQIPQIASVNVRKHARQSFEDTVAKNMLTMKMINLFFAVIIALGVVYNGARISLSERSRELATLRVIGFTRREISMILLGELGVITLLALPLGLFIGYWFAWLLALFLDQEVFRFPLVIERSTYGLAVSIVLTASIACGLLVRRKLDHLDLVAVLKSRE